MRGDWVASAISVALLGMGCAGAVALADRDRERLGAAAQIPVAYRPSPAPFVDCPGDLGAVAWKRDVGLWEAVQDERTVSLRKGPPLDPARATADRFLSLASAAPGSPRFHEVAVAAEGSDRRALANRFQSLPVLLFETTRTVLAGCFYAYQPWFDVRATLRDAASGDVLWRDSCGGLYPPDPSREATLAELEADGKQLYASLLEARASQCARELLASFQRGGAPRAPDAR